MTKKKANILLSCHKKSAVTVPSTLLGDVAAIPKNRASPRAVTRLLAYLLGSFPL